MNQLFNIDNPVMQFISKIFDLVILNLIFILFSIPVITMGASLCGMYYVSLKIVRGEDPYIWKNFFKAFRQNFKQGTLVWILLLLIFAFLGMDFYILNSQDTVLFAVIRVLLWVICGILSGDLTFRMQHKTGIQEFCLYDRRFSALHDPYARHKRCDPLSVYGIFQVLRTGHHTQRDLRPFCGRLHFLHLF